MTNFIEHNSKASVDTKKGFRVHFLIFILATPIIWLVWYLTNTTYPWPFWSTPLWAIGVLFHYLGVFVFKKSRNK